VPTRTRIWLALSVASLLWPSRSRAETFSTTLDATGSCPDRSAFQAEILARAQSAKPAAIGNYEFAVVLRDRGTKIEGILTIRTSSGSLSTRHLEGISCAEVTSAFALIAALTLDPKARSEPIGQLLGDKELPKPTAVTKNRAAAEGSEMTDTSRAVAPTSTPSPPASPAKGVAAPDRPTTDRRSASQPRPPRSPTEPSFALSMGAEIGWLSSIAPNGMLIGNAMAEGRSSQGPVVRLVLGGGPASNRGNGRGEFARYSYLGGGLDVGWALYRSDSLLVDALLQVSLGDLEVVALERGRVTRRAPTHSTFFAVGPALGVTRTWSWVGLGVLAALPVTLNRPGFEIEVPESENFSMTPVVGAEVALLLTLPLTRARPVP
jgi:hypothetical protein